MIHVSIATLPWIQHYLNCYFKLASSVADPSASRERVWKKRSMKPLKTDRESDVLDMRTFLCEMLGSTTELTPAEPVKPVFGIMPEPSVNQLFDDSIAPGDLHPMSCLEGALFTSQVVK